MKALSKSLSINIGRYAELVLLLTRLLYLVITSLINPFYCYMLFSVCLYKPQINIITLSLFFSRSRARYSSLSSIAPGRSHRLHPVSVQNCCGEVLVSRPTLARPRRVPLENGIFDFVLASPAMSCISCSSYLDCLRDRR